ncbi:TIGR02270 family protein [Roseateles amylovorans]|uniref:TIGR02270 family protein n=1 Tax=Roseateles amylovorans TaxID=2978473 RepID=A0ABY6B6U8_9BURK|nr:TIGR02270 family protein [Roseateles amylovorans]UXH80659.1 TIGR02270 family protein [Roseateles amylovorans]
MHNGFSPAEISALQNAPVLNQHAEEAAFLWIAREQAGLGPHYRFDQLATLDERLLAHLEGLLLSGSTGLQLALRALGEVDAGTLFVAAHQAFVRRDAEAMGHVVAVALSAPAWRAPVIAALSWVPPSTLEPVLPRLQSSAVSAHRALALSVQIERRVHPRQALVAAMEDPDPLLRAEGFRAVGELGLTGHRDRLQAAEHDADPGCRFWSAWSLALGGDEGAAESAYDVSHQAGQTAAGLDIAMRAGRPDWARETIRRLATEGRSQRLAVVGAGVLGDPAAVPWLLELCDEPTLAQAAGEAMASITGLDLEDPQWRHDAIALDEVHPDDVHAPWADPDALRRWWQAELARFRRGVRHLGGRPISEEAALLVLRHGTQRQRRSAAIEAARLRPGTAVFPTTGRADWQHQRWAVA